MSSNNWKTDVNAILAAKGGTRMNGKKASERTQTMNKEVVYAAFRTWHDLGLKVQSPRNVKNKHIQALMQHGLSKGKSIKTLRNELSRLRCFFRMCGKPGIVLPFEHYLPDAKKTEVHSGSVTHEDEGQEDLLHGIDLVDLFRTIDSHDMTLGLIARLQLAFGMRLEEALKCDPWAQDYKSHVEIYSGMGKGGRPRIIPILSDAQRTILDTIKERTRPGTVLGWKYTRFADEASLARNKKRYSNSLSALGLTKGGLGITGHSFRAIFAQNYALLCGMVPPALGGSAAQLANPEMRSNQTKISQSLGHNRTDVLTSYYGSFPGKRKADLHTQEKHSIEKSLALLGADLLTVPESRISDCQEIVNAMQQYGIEMTLEQAQAIWKEWANRWALEWTSPESIYPVCVGMSHLVIKRQDHP